MNTFAETATGDRQDLSFLCVDGTDYTHPSYALRYHVYCEEKHFLRPQDYPDGEEIDEFDSNAIHLSAIDRQDRILGTIRLVQPDDNKFPLLHHCDISLTGIPTNTAEISRLAVAKLCQLAEQNPAWNTMQNSADDACSSSKSQQQDYTRSNIVLGLYKAMYQESKRRGIDYWLAAMEKSLARLLRRFNFLFTPIGPEVDYYGPVTPYLARIVDIEQAVMDNCPLLYREFTEQTLN